MKRRYIDTYKIREWILSMRARLGNTKSNSERIKVGVIVVAVLILSLFVIIPPTSSSVTETSLKPKDSGQLMVAELPGNTHTLRCFSNETTDSQSLPQLSTQTFVKDGELIITYLIKGKCLIFGLHPEIPEDQHTII